MKETIDKYNGLPHTGEKEIFNAIILNMMQFYISSLENAKKDESTQDKEDAPK